MTRFILTSLLLALASPFTAQVVPVTLTASLTSQDGKALPVSGQFWFVTLDGRDSIAAHTDGTGTARLDLPPGSYRVRSHQRAALGGRAWYWDVPATVTGPTIITLTSANAQESAPSGDLIVMDAPPLGEDAGSRRGGFWIGFGPAYGTVDSDRHEGWESVGGFTIHLGGTVSPHLRIGGSIDTWARHRDDVGHAQSNVTLVLMYFPSTTLGLRLTGGVGVSGRGRYQVEHGQELADDEWETRRLRRGSPGRPWSPGSLRSPRSQRSTWAASTGDTRTSGCSGSRQPGRDH